MKDLAILVCTHSGHRRFLKFCLEQLKKIDARMIIAGYDYPYDQTPPFEHDRVLPSPDVMKMADMWFFSEIVNSGGGVGPGWMKQQLYGMELVKKTGAEYVLSINGDCAIVKPDGVVELIGMMIDGDGDLISSHYKINKESGRLFIGTMCYIAKTEIAAKISAGMWNLARANPHKDIPESLIGQMIEKEKIKCVPVENQESVHFSYGTKGTFFKYVELRHLHGTEKWRKGSHHKPLPKYMYDIRHMPLGQLNALNTFWNTGKTDRLLELKYWEGNPRNPDAAKKFAEEV